MNSFSLPWAAFLGCVLALGGASGPAQAAATAMVTHAAASMRMPAAMPMPAVTASTSTLPTPTIIQAQPLIDYSITAFTTREGAPAQVNGLVQTPDGFLWIASAQGLVRFDGVRFERRGRRHSFPAMA